MSLKQEMRHKGGSELIISPKGVLYHLNMARRDGFPPRFLMMGDPKRVDEAAKYLDGGKVRGRAQNREFYSVWGKYKGVKVGLMGTGIGTDNTEIALTELHAVFEYNSKKDLWAPLAEPLTLIRAGTSGSPQSDIRLGTLAITENAIGLDNTGLFYLHKPLAEYKNLNEAFYTPDNKIAFKVWKEVRRVLPKDALHLIRPYVSTATSDVVEALREASGELVKQGKLVAVESGITTTASGFFGPQGRQVGRMQNIVIPDLQERLSGITVKKPLATDDPVRAANNEMETSLLLRLGGEILGYRTGALCSVIANRAKGEFISVQEFTRSVHGAIVAGLEALIRLA